MRINKQKATEILRSVEGDSRFFAADGSVFSSLAEFAERVMVMPQEAFNHHCSREKCDFADWIEHVFGDAVLAKNLRAAKGLRAKVEKLAVDRVAQLERYL